MLIVNHFIQIPYTEMDFTYARSSGKGGQNVNKVNSKAVLSWNAKTSAALPEAVKERFLDRFASRLSDGGRIVIHSDRFRDQPRNANDCLEKLREMILSVAVAPKKRRPTKPTRSSKLKRLESKKLRSQTKKLRSERY